MLYCPKQLNSHNFLLSHTYNAKYYKYHTLTYKDSEQLVGGLALTQGQVGRTKVFDCKRSSELRPIES